MTNTVRASGLAALMFALMSTAASANDLGLRANLNGDWNHADDDGGDGDVWNLGGDVVVPLFDGGFNIQGDLGYHNIDTNPSIDGWHFGGAAFWRGEHGDVGVSISHAIFSIDGSLNGDANVTAYGAFGEIFAGEQFTVSAHGGWFSGSDDVDGNYWGAGAKFYAMPDLSIGAGYDRTHVDHLGSLSVWHVTGEWQFTHSTPLSVYVGYSNADIEDLGDSNVWTVGIRWRFGGEDGGSLVVNDRTNAVENTTMDFGHSLVF